MDSPLDNVPILLNKLNQNEGLPFVEYMEHCLYHPSEGYYTQDRQRVGAKKSSDFVTNISVRSIFAPAVIEAVTNLLTGEDLSKFTFCEIGAEPGVSLLDEQAHPFAEVRVVRQQDQRIPLPSGKVILFANEWLDALPFVRLIHREGEWKELFVIFDQQTGELAYREESPVSTDAQELKQILSGCFPEGYQIDLSLEAERRLAQWLPGIEKGLFLTFDYGSTWEAITHALPQGTGRAYRHHQTSQDLLAHPGQQDLTCNVCWDRIAQTLQAHGFKTQPILRQETFLMNYASSFLQKTMESKSPEAMRQKARIMQLIHPAHMGAAFQVLAASSPSSKQKALAAFQ